MARIPTLESRRVGLPDPVLGAPDIGLAAFGSRVEQATGQVADMLQRVAAGTANEQRNADVMKFGRESNDQVLQFYRDMPKLTSEEVEPAFDKLIALRRQTLGKIKDPDVRARAESHFDSLSQTLGQRVALDKTRKAVRASQSEGVLAERQLVQAIEENADEGAVKTLIKQAVAHIKSGLGTQYKDESEVKTAIILLHASVKKARISNMGDRLASASNDLAENPDNLQPLIDMVRLLNARVEDETISPTQSGLQRTQLQRVQQRAAVEKMISEGNPEGALEYLSPKRGGGADLPQGVVHTLRRAAIAAQASLGGGVSSKEERAAKNRIARAYRSLTERMNANPPTTLGEWERTVKWQENFLQYVAAVMQAPEMAKALETELEKRKKDWQEYNEHWILRMLDDSPEVITTSLVNDLHGRGGVSDSFYKGQFLDPYKKAQMAILNQERQFAAVEHAIAKREPIVGESPKDARAAFNLHFEAGYRKLSGANIASFVGGLFGVDAESPANPVVLANLEARYLYDVSDRTMQYIQGNLAQGTHESILNAATLIDKLGQISPSKRRILKKSLPAEDLHFMRAVVNLHVPGGKIDFAEMARKYSSRERNDDFALTDDEKEAIEAAAKVHIDGVRVEDGLNFLARYKSYVEFQMRDTGKDLALAIGVANTWVDKHFGVDEFGIPVFRLDPPHIANSEKASYRRLRMDFAKNLLLMTTQNVNPAAPERVFPDASVADVLTGDFTKLARLGPLDPLEVGEVGESVFIFDKDGDPVKALGRDVPLEQYHPGFEEHPHPLLFWDKWVRENVILEPIPAKDTRTGMVGYQVFYRDPNTGQPIAMMVKEAPVDGVPGRLIPKIISLAHEDTDRAKRLAKEGADKTKKAVDVVVRDDEYYDKPTPPFVSSGQGAPQSLKPKHVSVLAPPPHLDPSPSSQHRSGGRGPYGGWLDGPGEAGMK